MTTLPAVSDILNAADSLLKNIKGLYRAVVE